MSEPECEKHVFEAVLDVLYVIAPNRYSSEGYVFKLFDGMINWVLRKQLIIIISIIEAELLGILYAGK